MKALFLLLALGSAGCASSALRMLELADAETDREVEEAAAYAARVVAERGEDLDRRAAAAKALGRLGRASPEVVAALREVLADPTEEATLRAFSAWALGELRQEASLGALLYALERPLDPRTAQYALDGLAKHFALLSASEDRLVGAVEQMVRFAARQPGRPPPIYDVLARRTRTLPVGVKVLGRAAEAVAAQRQDAGRQAELYAALFELCARLEASEAELAAGSGGAEVATQQILRVFGLADRRARLLVLWYLGRLGKERAVAGPAAAAWASGEGGRRGRPALATTPAARFLAVWALSRMLVDGPGARAALAQDVLPEESNELVLRLLADLSSRPEELDLLQKVLGLGEEGAR